MIVFTKSYLRGVFSFCPEKHMAELYVSVYIRICILYVYIIYLAGGLTRIALHRVLILQKCLSISEKVGVGS